MPTLQEERLERVDLPAIPGAPESDGAWVVIDTSALRAGDTSLLDNGITGGQYSLGMLSNRIKEWNFTDAAGAVLPITYENVYKLHVDHYELLASKINNPSGELSVDEKKDSSPTSARSIQVQTTLE